MGIGIIYTRMNIGGYIVIVTYMEKMFGTLYLLHIFLFLVSVTLLPEDAASKPSSTTIDSNY